MCNEVRQDTFCKIAAAGRRRERERRYAKWSKLFISAVGEARDKTEEQYV